MKIKILASGSKANCYYLDDGKTSILIEAGLNIRLLQKLLQPIGGLSEIKGCIVTHEHNDHCSGVSSLLLRAIDCYMTKGTAESRGFLGKNLKIINANKQFNINSFIIKPFNVNHDAKEPVGFLIYSTHTKEKLVFITDTFYVKEYFPKLNYIMIECNFSYKILLNNIKTGKVHPAMAKRLMESHFEIKKVKQFFVANDLSRVKEIYLLHISDRNGDATFFKNEIQNITGIPVYI